MKTGTLIGIVLLAAASVAGAVWVFREKAPAVTTAQGPTTSPAKSADQGDADPKNPCPPLPAPGEPVPKIVVPEIEYRFGTMEAFQEQSHKFVIRNEGKGNLLVKKGATTCKCTMSAMEDKPIPPGESIEVTLTWKPLVRMEEWNQTANLCTNDASSRKITLKVSGDVVERLSITPKDLWQLGEVLEGKPSQVSGQVYSMVLDKDKFKIKDVKVAGTTAIKASWKPLSAEELATHKAKSGYLIQLDASSGLPAGSFSFPVSIETSVKEAREDGTEGEEVTLKLQVVGSRNGPFTFISGSAANDGANWIGEKRLIALGRFDELKGGKRSLPFFVRNCPKEGLKFLEQKCENCSSKPLKLSIEPDESFKGKARYYKLHIEYPPGSDKNPKSEEGMTGCRVRVKTNHPDAPEFDLQLYYQTF